jgi:hypothetical protein
VVVLLGQHDHFDARDVRVHGQQIVRQVVVDVARITFVQFGGFM